MTRARRHGIPPKNNKAAEFALRSLARNTRCFPDSSSAAVAAVLGVFGILGVGGVGIVGVLGVLGVLGVGGILGVLIVLVVHTFAPPLFVQG